MAASASLNAVIAIDRAPINIDCIDGSPCNAVDVETYFAPINGRDRVNATSNPIHSGRSNLLKKIFNYRFAVAQTTTALVLSQTTFDRRQSVVDGTSNQNQISIEYNINRNGLC